MAETYGIIDWRQLPLATAATLAQGLSSSSRVARKLTGSRVDEKTLLLAVIADRLGHLAWMFSEDGQKGRNHPAGILEVLMQPEKEKEPGFASVEEFEAAWAAITGINQGGEADG